MLAHPALRPIQCFEAALMAGRNVVESVYWNILRLLIKFHLYNPDRFNANSIALTR